MQPLYRSKELCQKGKSKAKNNDIPLAISFFEEALQVDSNCTEARLKLAQLLTLTESYALADEQYKILLKQSLLKKKFDTSLLKKINRFRLKYKKNITQDRLKITCAYSFTNPDNHAPLFFLGDISFLPLKKQVWDDSWIPNLFIAAPLELSLLPRNIHEIPSFKVGVIQNLAPHMDQLSKDIPYMDALVVPSEHEKNICKNFTNAPIYTCPLMPLTLPSTRLYKKPEFFEIDERSLDTLCILSSEPSSKITADFFQTIQKIQKETGHSIECIFSFSADIEKKISQARLIIHLGKNPDEGFLPLFLHTALSYHTKVLTSANIEKTLGLISDSPIENFQLKNLEEKYDKAFEDFATQASFNRQKNKSQNFLKKFWHPYKIWKSLLKKIMHSDLKSSVTPVSNDRLYSDAIAFHKHSIDVPLISFKSLCRDFDVEWKKHSHQLEWGNNFAFILSQYYFKKSSYSLSFFSSDVNKIFKKLLNQDPLHPIILHNKIQLGQTLLEHYDIPCLKTLEKSLSIRYGEHYFFEDYLLLFPQNPLFQNTFSALKAEKKTISNKEYIEKYRNIISYALYLLLGNYHLERSLLYEAKNYYQLASSSLSHAVTPHLKIALISLKEKNITETQMSAKKALQNDPTHLHAQFILENTTDPDQDAHTLAQLIQNML